MRPRLTASSQTSPMRARVSITWLSGPMAPRERALRRSATLLPDRSGCLAAVVFFLAVLVVLAFGLGLVVLFDRDAELERLFVLPLALRVDPALRVPELR